MYWDNVAMALNPKSTAHLKWVNTPVTFDASNCPENMMGAGQLPLITSATIANIRVHHVLIDVGTVLSVMSLHAF
jgi:hypothetical protein